MIMRAENLEILSPNAAELLWRYRAAKGWHKREPFDLPEETPVEQPCLLKRCIEMITGEGGRSKRALLETDIGLGASDVEMLASLPPSFFDADAAPVIRLEPRLRNRLTEFAESEVVQFRRPG